MWTIKLSKRALKDRQLLAQAGLETKARNLLALMSIDPFINPPGYEKLIGDYKGCYSRRINYKHRLVYSVNDEEHTIYVLIMWSHYE